MTIRSTDVRPKYGPCSGKRCPGCRTASRALRRPILCRDPWCAESRTRCSRRQAMHFCGTGGLVRFNVCTREVCAKSTSHCTRKRFNCPRGLSRPHRFQMLAIRRYRLPAESAPCRWSSSALVIPNTRGQSKETFRGRGLGCGASGGTEAPKPVTLVDISLDASLFAIAPKLKLVELGTPRKQSCWET